MPPCRLRALVLLALLSACASPADPTPTSDALDAPAPSVPSRPAAAPIDSRFPHAPDGAGWVTVGTIRWTAPVPLRQDPVYEADNGSHLVDYGDDDPGAVWGRRSAVVADSAAPGGTALECRLPKGLAGGTGATKIGGHPDWQGDGPLLWNPALSTGHLYIGMYVRFSPGFNLNGNIGQKVLYLKSDLPENRQLNHMPGIFVNDDRGGNQLWPTYSPQHPFGRMQVAGTDQFNFNDGRWHLLEMLQSPNTPGQHDGTLRMWIDGREAGVWTDAKFFEAGQTPSLNRLEINPIFGGGRNAVAADQWVRVGAMRVATR